MKGMVFHVWVSDIQLIMSACREPITTAMGSHACDTNTENTVFLCDITTGVMTMDNEYDHFFGFAQINKIHTKISLSGPARSSK